MPYYWKNRLGQKDRTAPPFRSEKNFIEWTRDEELAHRANIWEVLWYIYRPQIINWAKRTVPWKLPVRIILWVIGSSPSN